MNDIIAIRARAENATPGPWDIGEDQTEPFIYYHSLQVSALASNDGEDEWIDVTWCSCSQDPSQMADGAPKLKRAKANAVFIAYARMDVPALCDEVETLRADLLASTVREKRLRETLEFYANPEIYKPHPHGPAFDQRDLSFASRQALKDTSNE